MNTETTNTKTLGGRLKKLRVENKLFQEDIGEICGVGKATVSLWESDQVVPPTERLLMLRTRLQFTMDWLLLGEESTGEDPRIRALVTLYRESDPRGKDTILRVAEQESSYTLEPDTKRQESK